MNSTCPVFRFSEFRDLWNAPEPRIPTCLLETLFNGLPAILLIFWIAQYYIFHQRSAKSSQFVSSLNNTSKLVIILLCGGINMHHAFRSFSLHVSSQVDLHIFIALIYLIKSVLLAGMFLIVRSDRGLRVSGLEWASWLCELLFSLVSTIQTYIYPSSEHDHQLVIFCIQSSLSFTLFMMISLDQDNSEKTCNRSGLKSRDQSSFMSRLFLWWFTLLVKYGYKHSLEFIDLSKLNEDMNAEKTGQRFNRKVSHVDSNSVKLIPLLGQIFWKDLAMILMLQTFSNTLSMMIPILIKLFIGFIDSDLDEPTWHGYVLGISMFSCAFLSSLLSAHVAQISNSTRTKIRICVNAAIYNKILRMRKIDLRDFNTGTILNLISIDSSTLAGIVQRLNILWSAPFGLVLGAYLMYQTVGYVAFICLSSWLIIVFIASSFARLTRKYILAKLKVTDRRVKLINEILDEIKSIKFYAWEECLMEKISLLRQEELVQLKKLEQFESFLVLRILTGTWSCTVTLFTCRLLLQGQSLASKDMFYVLSIIETLARPMAFILRIVQNYMMASAAARRLEHFFNLKEVPSYVRREDIVNAIEIKQGHFSWDTKTSKMTRSSGDKNITTSGSNGFRLRNVNLSIELGTLTCIIGSVGSGKSSLLGAMIGEMVKEHGQVIVKRDLRMAIVPQEAWIQNMTLRENILFGQQFDKERYWKVLTACELIEDIAILPGGNETEIGENGINLSGGQKQRVSLARAACQDADIYFLDDCLSALDAKVSKKIFNQVLHGKTGLFKGKTIVMATNRLNILNEVDQIILLEKGSIVEVGSPDQLVRRGGKISEIMKIYSDHGKHSELDEAQSNQPADASNLECRKLIGKEFMAENQIETKVYLTLARKCSKPWLILCLVSIPMYLWSSIYSRITLTRWSESTLSSHIQSSDYTYFVKYAILSIFEGFFLYTSLIGITFAYLKTCQGLHSDLLKGVLYSSIRFFDTTPIGRILNRFSSDLNSIDMVLREYLRYSFNCTLYIIPAIMATMIVEPRSAIIISVCILICLILMNFYMVANRRLKRLESVAKSPIFSHFRETVVGLDSVRTFGASQRFESGFHGKSNLHGNYEYLVSMILVWMAMIIGFLASSIFATISIFGVFGKEKRSGGEIGLLLSYAVRIINWLGSALNNISTFGEQLVAVERVLEYSELPEEGNRFKTPFEAWNPWPSAGKLEIESYSARHRQGLEPSLRALTAAIQPGEKVGIVGRTGAGKSSFALALFRLIEKIDGSIRIDGYDLEDIGLFHLRSGISIIPQDPVILSGSVRFNLDPFKEYSDEQVWRALEMSHLREYFEKFGAGLEYILAEGGKNLSGGQKQLICLARSLLKKSKIIVLDEATGSIDMETDALIQKTIRREFADSTMLIIAHRLDTIIDCDRIMVLDQGTIVELDTPQNLLGDECSRFHGLAEDAQVIIINPTTSICENHVNNT